MRSYKARITNQGFSAFFLESWLLDTYQHTTAVLRSLKSLEGDAVL